MTKIEVKLASINPYAKKIIQHCNDCKNFCLFMEGTTTNNAPLFYFACVDSSLTITGLKEDKFPCEQTLVESPLSK